MTTIQELSQALDSMHNKMIEHEKKMDFLNLKWQETKDELKKKNTHGAFGPLAKP